MRVRNIHPLSSALILLTLAVLASDSAKGAPTYLAPDDPALGRPAPPVAAPRVAQTHILIELGPGADEARFLERARGQGFRRLGRVSGTRWLTMAIPSGAAPREAAAAARVFPGVSRATPDVVLQAYHHVPPVSPPYVNDPLYIFDNDPSTKPACSPCTAEDIVDQWGLFRVDTESGWDTETGGVRADGKEIVIAIVDSGMDLDHDDLRDNLWVNPNEIPGDGIDNDGNGFIDDLHGADFVGAGVGSPTDDPASQDASPDIPHTGVWVEDFSAPWWWRFDGDPAVGDAIDNNGDFLIDLGVFHGTFVAGIAAAATNNINMETGLYEGFAGACWNCKLMPVRMIDAEGGGLMSNAAAAVRYAADQGAHIINASWGVNTNGLNPADVEILRQAIDYAVGKGVIVVAAAGNAGTAGTSFPAAMANTIAVGSSDWLDNRSAFSSYGYFGEIPDDGIDNDGNGWVDDVVDVIAPGELIWSSTVISAYEAFILNGWDWFCCADNPSPDDWYPGEDAYTRSDGTSFATPLVAGHIGVLLSANCDANLADVRQAIRNNALDVGLPGYDAQTGFGRLQFVVPTDLGTGNCGGTGENSPPVAVNDAFNVTTGGSLSVGAPGVLQNDSDPNGDLMTAVLITGPARALSFSLNADGSFSYTHDGSTSATDTFTYKAVDSGGLESNASTVTITIDTPGGNPNAMYMQDVSFDYKGRALNVTVTVRRDSDADGVGERSDAGVGKTVVYGKLCAVSAPTICHFEGTPIGTGGNGKATYKLFGASGQYRYTWTSIEHPDYSWDPSLDVTNPAVGP